MVAATLVPRFRPLPVDEGPRVCYYSKAAGGGSLHFELLPDVKGADHYVFPVVKCSAVKSIRLVGGDLDLLYQFRSFFLFTVLLRI